MNEKPAAPGTTRQTLCPARDYKVVCETPMACGAQRRYADDPVHPNRVEVPASQTTTYADRNVMLEALYQALKDYRDGKFTGECIGVGILDTQLSAVYRAVERSAGIVR